MDHQKIIAGIMQSVHMNHGQATTLSLDQEMITDILLLIYILDYGIMHYLINFHTKYNAQ